MGFRKNPLLRRNIQVYIQPSPQHYLYSYDSENGFSLLEQQALTYKNTEGYRGIYKDNDFYVAGNGEIKHFKLAE